MLISVQSFAKSPMSYGIFMVPFLSISSVYISYENVQPNPDSIQGLQILEVLVCQMNQKACTGKRQLHCRPRMAQTVPNIDRISIQWPARFTTSTDDFCGNGRNRSAVAVNMVAEVSQKWGINFIKLVQSTSKPHGPLLSSYGNWRRGCFSIKFEC